MFGLSLRSCDFACYSDFRIKELNDDAAMYGRRTFQQDPTIKQFDVVEELIQQLAAYYDKHWKAHEAK
jgi:hypothetical protein